MVSKHSLPKDHKEVVTSHSFSLNSGHRVLEYQINIHISFASTEHHGLFSIPVQKKSQLKQRKHTCSLILSHY